jgi:hypothetical protein
MGQHIGAASEKDGALFLSPSAHCITSEGRPRFEEQFRFWQNELHPPLRLILDAIQNDAGVPWGQEQNFGIAIETRDPP